MVNVVLDTVIKGGQVVTTDGVQKLDIGVKDGRIVVVGPHGALDSARQIIDASGKYILPGLVDPENHLGTQRPLKDSLSSETRAASVRTVSTFGP